MYKKTWIATGPEPFAMTKGCHYEHSEVIYKKFVPQAHRKLFTHSPLHLSFFIVVNYKL